MKRRLMACTGALVAVATCAALAGFVRPVHLSAAAPPPEISAPPTVAAVTPELPPFPKPPEGEDFTKTDPEPARPKSNPVAVEPSDADIPPIPDIVAVPREDPPLPRVANMLPARSVMPAPASMFPAPAAVPEGPADTNRVFREIPIQREQPEIRVVDRSALPGALVIRRGNYVRRWNWSRTGEVVVDTIPPGEYEYEIHGPETNMTGEPDIAGTLRCRKQRRYEVRLRRRSPDDPLGTIFQDLGDQ